ncbi:hypothetical protein AAG906_025794 [Vitis piasezkii]
MVTFFGTRRVCFSVLPRIQRSGTGRFYLFMYSRDGNLFEDSLGRFSLLASSTIRSADSTIFHIHTNRNLLGTRRSVLGTQILRPVLGGSTIFLFCDGNLFGSLVLHDPILSGSTIFRIHTNRNLYGTTLVSFELRGIYLTVLAGFYHFRIPDRNLLGTRPIGFRYSPQFYDPVLAGSTIFRIHDRKLLGIRWSIIGYSPQFYDLGISRLYHFSYSHSPYPFKDSPNSPVGFGYSQFYDRSWLDSTIFTYSVIVTFFGTHWGFAGQFSILCGLRTIRCGIDSIIFRIHCDHKLFDSADQFWVLILPHPVFPGSTTLTYSHSPYPFTGLAGRFSVLAAVLVIRCLADSTIFRIHTNRNLLRDYFGRFWVLARFYDRSWRILPFYVFTAMVTFSGLARFYDRSWPDSTILRIHIDGKLFVTRPIGFRYSQFYDPSWRILPFSVFCDGNLFGSSGKFLDTRRSSRIRHWRFYHFPYSPDGNLFGTRG